ncbi:Crp/Fnr family transcriptional regulator [Pectinatus brassicae]|uniref:CRP-like cAMP-binding protein n=1 Tax=Pectinatus brassicae TaxID=862415 RepID=A0A840UFW6_9FIRM|nr:Crp/Fnr family transcriptional regulator [Pectinatus brassicae]MBB5335996.1 CRP-like cAMP-binding protein [Pectinatus brassicae]
MDEVYSVLSRCTLFENIGESEFKSLLSCVNSFTKKFKRDEYIFFAGDEINYIGILISGSIELIKEDLVGTRYIMDYLSPADIFAEGIACTKKHISPITVRTKQNSTVLFIPFDKIIKTCSNSCGFHVQLIKNMMLLLGEKNYYLNRKMELLMLKGLREKLATFLLAESNKRNSLIFAISLNRNELAEYLNVSRTSMCRELATMKSLGIIDYYKNSFKIISVDLLKENLMR